VRGSALAQVWQARSPKDGQKPVPRFLSAIAHPVLLLWGRRDRIFPVADGERLASLLPAATLRVFDDAGHLIHEECAKQVNETITSFLRKTG
jgi:pimeloyl-ACP methyl ester carboxylesterase